MINEGEQYTVRKQERVRKALNIDHCPVGLEIELVNVGGNEPTDDGSCRVTPRPPGVYKSGLEVSNSLLQELLEEGAIEMKNPPE